MPSSNFRENQELLCDCRVGGAGRNAQFHFGSCIDFAPHHQLTSDKCGAFPHPGQAIVSLTALAGENRWINAFSIVPHAQSELLIVIADFNFDLPCLSVAKGVPQRFGSNFVDLVSEDGMQISRLALNRDAECRSMVGLSRFRVLLRGCLWPARDRCFALWNRAIPAPHPGLR